MTLTLELEPKVQSLLEKRARAEGCDVQDYVQKLVEKEVIANAPSTRFSPRFATL